MLMTHNQIQCALRLALAHGHEWAVAWSEDMTTTEEAGRGLDPYIDVPQADYLRLFAVGLGRNGEAKQADVMAAIDAAVDAYHRTHCGEPPCRCFPGLSRPDIGPDGAIIHTTMTGRLSWRVDVSGAVTLDVCRPARVVGGVAGHIVVLRATVPPDGPIGVASSGLAEERHWDCLARALAALGHAVGLREVAS